VQIEEGLRKLNINEEVGKFAAAAAAAPAAAACSTPYH
jgi:hypothetical protein